MTNRVENSNLQGFEPLLTPLSAKQAHPLSERAESLVLRTRAEIKALLHGGDPDRMLLIVGPCSIHDQQAAYEYARRLAELRAELEDVAVIVMRTYFEKPRTTIGWKGLINDPHLDGSCDIASGLLRARETVLAINELGVPCASEALDPITPHYLADLLSWASIGARTTESQTHREMASGLSMPVGFKNGTDGSLTPAVNALISAGHQHAFLGINDDGLTSVVKTRGNPDRHVVLRGGARPNYHTEDIEEAQALVAEVAPDIARAVMVDSSHGNSSKDYRRQGRVCKDVVRQFALGQRAILGLLVESNLKAGKQQWSGDKSQLEYGVSITDGCIGWDESAELLRWIAGQLRGRRAA
ncbi:MAG: 3-deoxy-7-phosphoheptulonate synthase [Myxococcales bacterium]|nr:3-deoxy-7-phosphoheptulonate synthase [Myxococcales bacterium]